MNNAQSSLLNSRAVATSKTYKNAFNKFSIFCGTNSLSFLPAEPVAVILYLQKLSNTLAYSSLLQTASAISWAHSLANEADPTQSAVVKNLLQACKRGSKTVVHKEPATVNHLWHLASVYRRNESPKNLRTLVISVLAYSGCMRISDFINLPVGSFVILENYIQIQLGRTKTDQFREGNRKYIPHGKEKSLCPVRLLSKWLKLLKNGSELPAFPMLTNKTKPISISSFRENLEEAFKNADLPKITPHSFRAGFATNAINAGVEVTDLKEFGLWQSESSIQRYSKRSISKKLQTGSLAGL